MGIFTFHVCPNCHNLQALEEQMPTRTVCIGCGSMNTTPTASLFGREEWVRSQHPARMIAVLKEMGISLTPRKIRLISCAVARSQSFSSEDDKLREVVALAEEWADTGASPDATRVRRSLNTMRGGQYWARIGARCLAEDATDIEVRSYPIPELLAPIYRDQFVNPFAQSVWNLNWFTSTVRDLAQHIYAAHEFSAMPILADALQDAGCDDEQILTHCRANKPHARGCWVLDAILGKS